MIFETNRVRVRKLIESDLNAFHRMQSNPLVMQYATGIVKSLEAHKIELDDLISKYDVTENSFWIYAIERKTDAAFIGTVALVKDDGNDEVGYRFLQEFWGSGFGTETCQGLIEYCKKKNFKKLTAYAVDANIASQKILEKLHFKFVRRQIAEDLQLSEIKYELYL
jgi:ribosomal-protein-alanine N-acetyltransferase